MYLAGIWDVPDDFIQNVAGILVILGLIYLFAPRRKKD